MNLDEKYKQNTNKKLLQYYAVNGFKKTVLTAKQMYNVNLKDADWQFKINLNGEICETILEIGILEYIKRNPQICKDWILKKGLILKDVDNLNSDFSTEIDLLLATPEMIYIFECKSYSGDKTLTKECTITTNSRTFDVFKQNALHANIFFKQFKAYLTKQVIKPPIQLVLFNMSNGRLIDKRNDRYKQLMPVIQIETLFSFLDRNKLLTGKSGKLWNITYVRKSLNVIEKHSKQSRKEHLEYVKRIHGE